MYKVLARKWRPKTFHELVGQQHVTQALTYALAHNRIHHAYLFTGTRGVGKTTIARIFAKSLNCQINGVSAEPCGECEVCQEIDAGRFPDLLEVDAASRTGVDDTRELLDNVPYAPVKGRYKVYLIDEVHMFSNSSFNALLKTLEEPPPHVKFILATTDPQKMPPTVLSRCLQFHLKNMRPEQIKQHMGHILSSEKIPYEEEALKMLADAANGSMRDGLSLLDQAIAYGQGEISAQNTAHLLGAVPERQVLNLVFSVVQGDAKLMRSHLLELDTFAPDYQVLLKKILYVLQEITIIQLNAVIDGQDVHADLHKIADYIPVELLQLWYQIATDGWQAMPYHPDARLSLEMTLLRMIALRPLLPTADPATVKPIPAVRLPTEEVGQNVSLMARHAPEDAVKESTSVDAGADLVAQHHEVPNNVSTGEQVDVAGGAGTMVSGQWVVADVAGGAGAMVSGQRVVADAAGSAGTMVSGQRAGGGNRLVGEVKSVDGVAPPFNADRVVEDDVGDLPPWLPESQELDDFSDNYQADDSAVSVAHKVSDVLHHASPAGDFPVYGEGEVAHLVPSECIAPQADPVGTLRELEQGDFPVQDERETAHLVSSEYTTLPDDPAATVITSEQVNAATGMVGGKQMSLLAQLADCVHHAEQWDRVLRQLSLSDFARRMLEHSVVLQCDDGEMRLGLNSGVYSMCQPQTQREVCAAICQWLGQECRITFSELVDNSEEIPAVIQSNLIKKAQQEAESAFMNHPVVVQLSQRLGATVDSNSIELIDKYFD